MAAEAGGDSPESCSPRPLIGAASSLRKKVAKLQQAQTQSNNMIEQVLAMLRSMKKEEAPPPPPTGDEDDFS